MFAEDIDMFAEDGDEGAGAAGAGAGGIAVGPGNARRPAGALGGRGHADDDAEDAEGYYNFRLGEVLLGRYEVSAHFGSGVFSSVLRCYALDGASAAAPRPGEAPAQQQHQPPSEQPAVAIKVIRNNEVMQRQAQTEIAILRKLAAADPAGRAHCVRFQEHFEYRGHVCLVFEALDMNLREVVKKYGRNVGINLKAVRLYAFQLLCALRLMRKCGVVHADIKPDNILVSEDRSCVKVCDFGSAMFEGNNELTPYLVSRFYRAPEVMLGLRYGPPIDMWAIGCCLFEAFTGQILFPGRSNNEMLKRMMEYKGAFSKKMIKKGAFAEQHFDDSQEVTFLLVEEDRATQRPVRTLVTNPKASKDFFRSLQASSGAASGSFVRKKLMQLADLLDKMLHLDPDRRIGVEDALQHPFIRTQF